MLLVPLGRSFSEGMAYRIHVRAKSPARPTLLAVRMAGWFSLRNAFLIGSFLVKVLLPPELMDRSQSQA